MEEEENFQVKLSPTFRSSLSDNFQIFMLFLCASCFRVNASLSVSRDVCLYTLQDIAENWEISFSFYHSLFSSRKFSKSFSINVKTWRFSFSWSEFLQLSFIFHKHPVFEFLEKFVKFDWIFQFSLFCFLFFWSLSFQFKLFPFIQV